MKTSRRKDGRFERQITLTDAITGQSYTKHVYARTTDELEDKIRKLKSKYSGLAKSTFTVEGWLDYYMSNRRENGNPTSTLDTYQGLIDNYIKNTRFAKIKMDTLTIPACRQFFSEFRVADPNAAGTRTKQMLYIILHAAFRQAWKEKIIPENPLDFMDKPRHRPQDTEVMSKEDFDLLLTAVTSEQMKRIFRFARNTGMRRGEICAVQLKDINLESRYIIVNKAVKLYQKQWIVDAPKTKSSVRAIAIPNSMVELLKEQIKYLGDTSPDTYLFKAQQGHQFLTPNSLTRAFADARNAVGLPKVMVFRSLRATVATYLAECDVNPKKIQAKLGHATPYMTLTRYIKKTPVMQDSIVGFLEEF